MTFDKLHAQVKEIEEEIHERGMITEHTRDHLYAALEETSHAMRILRQIASSLNELTAAHIGSRLSAMEEKVIYLYGKINDLLVASKLSLIIQEAEDLERALSGGNSAEIASKVNILATDLRQVRTEYRLSRQEKQEISQAHEALKKANALLRGEKSPSHVHVAFEEECDEEEIEPYIMMIWEIADLHYQHKTREAKSKLCQLPQAYQTLFRRHCRLLGDKEDTLTTIQALIATANEIAHIEDEEPYVSLEEIQKIFCELDAIRVQQQLSHQSAG